MKQLYGFLLALGLLAGSVSAQDRATVAPMLPLNASRTSPATHRVLDLASDGSHVEFPAGSFTNLDEVTAEGWFKFRSFDYYHRLFNFCASSFEFDAFNYGWTSVLVCARIVRDANGVAHHLVLINAPGLLRLNEWCHVAVVARTNSLKLYFNGVLVQRETEATSGQFQPAKDLERRNYLGRTPLAATPGMTIWNPDFDGLMDEVRVWRGERTEEQIRDSMFKDLTGKEPGLVGLWNFNDDTANGSLRRSGTAAGSEPDPGQSRSHQCDRDRLRPDAVAGHRRAGGAGGGATA